MLCDRVWEVPPIMNCCRQIIELECCCNILRKLDCDYWFSRTQGGGYAEVCGYRSLALWVSVQVGDPKPPGLSHLVCVAARLSRNTLRGLQPEYMAWFAPRIKSLTYSPTHVRVGVAGFEWIWGPISYLLLLQLLKFFRYGAHNIGP